MKLSPNDLMIAIAELLNKTAKEKTSEEHEILIITKDGKTIPLKSLKQKP